MEPERILAAYPQLQVINLESIRSYSHARVWKVTTKTAAFAMKCWAETKETRMPRKVLEQHHGRLIKLNQKLDFIPVPVATSNQSTIYSDTECTAELLTWMPGQACTKKDLPNVFWDLSRFHRECEILISAKGPCNSVWRVFDALTGFTEKMAYCVETRMDKNLVIERAYQVVSSDRHRWISAVRSWLDRPVLIHPIHGDCWSPNLLMNENKVSGLIDFTSYRIDHPIADYARLFGSLGIRSYLEMCDFLQPVYPNKDLQDLCFILLQGGRLASLRNWLKWLYYDHTRVNLDEALPRMTSILADYCHTH